MNSNFNFKVPANLIAQSPKSSPEKASLLVVSRKDNKFFHRSFTNLTDYLKKGDLLVLNNTACLKSRFWGVLKNGGQVEVTLVTRKENDVWEAIVRPGGGLKKNQQIYFNNGGLFCDLTKTTSYGGWILRFYCGHGRKLENFLKAFADVNIPFYIKRKAGLCEYQNVYARIPGSTQCPTAGLHFTNKLLNKIKEKGVGIGFITLHIGGSILPLTTKDYKNLRIHEEYFEVNAQVRDKIRQTRAVGGKVVAVGTTTVRALESASSGKGNIKPQKGWTGLTLKPGYNFKIIDGFLTNFHLPNSSHLFMTAAFAGAPLVMKSYEEAIRKRYKFLDFGDAMLII